MIKIALMSALIVGGASVALAQDAAAPAASDYPVCSKKITDKCMNPSAAPRKMKKMAPHKKAAKPAAKAEDKTAG
jgi:hypothetical protein